MTPRTPIPSDEHLLIKAELTNVFIDMLDKHRLYRGDETERREFGQIIEKVVKLFGDPKTMELWESVKRRDEAHTARVKWIRGYGGQVLLTVTTVILTVIVTAISHIHLFGKG